MSNQVFILTVGYPASGKSTLIDQLRQASENLNVVNGDPFRDFLRKEITHFADAEFSKQEPKTVQANKITKEYKRLMFESLIESGQSILFEGNHLQVSKRERWLKRAKEINPEIKTVILYFNIEEGELLKRYEEREEENTDSSWVEEFHEWRKDQLDVPSELECDQLMIYKLDETQEIIKELTRLLKNQTSECSEHSSEKRMS